MNRLLSNIDIDEVTGCWNWLGRHTSLGYGQVKQNGKGVLVHRIVARHVLGLKLNDPLRVCHRCDNPRCCNPRHLFLGTAQDNALDSVAKGRHVNTRKRFCKRGHEFTPENTLLKEREGKQVQRACRICVNKLQTKLRHMPERHAARAEYVRNWEASRKKLG